MIDVIDAGRDAAVKLAATLPNGDYLIEEAGNGLYGIACSPTCITVENGKVTHWYADQWCSDEIGAKTYRPHCNDRLIDAYPDRLSSAKDISTEWKSGILEPNYPATTTHIMAQIFAF